MQQGQPPFHEEAGHISPHQCAVCGYNLKGLVDSIACPECGTSIAASSHLASEQRSRAARRRVWVHLVSSIVILIVGNALAVAIILAEDIAGDLCEWWYRCMIVAPTGYGCLTMLVSRVWRSLVAVIVLWMSITVIISANWLVFSMTCAG